MRIDMHTHLWKADQTDSQLNDYLKEKNGYCDLQDMLSAEGLLESMEGILDFAIVLSDPVKYTHNTEDYHIVNEFVKNEIADHKDKLRAFCTVNVFDIKDALAEIPKYIEDYGFVGLKLHLNSQCFYPNDSNLFPIYEKMQEYRLPVLFHTGGMGILPHRDKYRYPGYIDDIACEFPELPVIMGHAGRGMYTETAILMRKHKNVYADVSANLSLVKGREYLAMQEMIRQNKIWAGSVDKLLFGTDYPFKSQSLTVEALENAFSRTESEVMVTKEDIDKILNRNAIDFCKKYKLL